MRRLNGGGPHAWPLFAGTGYVLGHFACPPDADRWRTLDWIGPQPHVVLPETAVRIGAEGGDPDVCTANEVLVYGRDTYYRRGLVNADGDRCTYLAVDDDLANALRLNGSHGIDRHTSPAALYVLTRQVRRALEGPHPDLLALDEALLLVLAHITGTPNQRTRSSTVEAVKALIGEQPIRQWRLAELAAAVHYSPYFLARMFRRHTGHSIAQYRRELCLRQSLPSALDPSADLSRVAERFGFSSHSHYTQAFRKTFGCTPTHARRVPLSGPLPFGQITVMAARTRRVAGP